MNVDKKGANGFVGSELTGGRRICKFWEERKKELLRVLSEFLQRLATDSLDHWVVEILLLW